MGLGERVRKRMLRNSELVGLTRFKFSDGQVAWVDEWTDLPADEERWWRLFAAGAHAQHIAGNFGAAPNGLAVASAVLEGEPALEDLCADLAVVEALPSAQDEMVMEVWAGSGLPVIQSVLRGRGAKKGRFALAAAGLPFAQLRRLGYGDLLDEFIAALAYHSQGFGWDPRTRQAAILAQMAALGQLAADGRIPDLYGFADVVAANDWHPAATPDVGVAADDEPDELTEASDRLDEQIKQAPVDDYFILILLAASAAGLWALVELFDQMADGVEPADEEDPEPAIVDALFDRTQDPAVCDRVVRAATWQILAAVIDAWWPDRVEETAKLARHAIPLDPVGEEAVARLLTLNAQIREGDNAAGNGDEIGPFERIGREGFSWLLYEVTRQQVEIGGAAQLPTVWLQAWSEAYAEFPDMLERLESANPQTLEQMRRDNGE